MRPSDGHTWSFARWVLIREIHSRELNALFAYVCCDALPPTSRKDGRWPSNDVTILLFHKSLESNCIQTIGITALTFTIAILIEEASIRLVYFLCSFLRLWLTGFWQSFCFSRPYSAPPATYLLILKTYLDYWCQSRGYTKNRFLCSPV